MKQYKHYGKNEALIIVIAKDLEQAKMIIKDHLEYEVENFYHEEDVPFDFDTYPITESDIKEGVMLHQRDNSWD